MIGAETGSHLKDAFVILVGVLGFKGRRGRTA